MFTNLTMNPTAEREDSCVMEKMLRYDMMLEVDGVLRSQDVRVELDREVQPGETISMHERDWLVTEVTAAKPNHGLDRRLIAREV